MISLTDWTCDNSAVLDQAKDGKVAQGLGSVMYRGQRLEKEMVEIKVSVSYIARLCKVSYCLTGGTLLIPLLERQG